MGVSGPNTRQKELIENVEGIYLADAGPGTGKTHTISLRYAYILENRDVDPDDILLITFTNNAAENMKERIINNCEYDKFALREAPISTFHSLCNRILNRYGFEAPKIIGINDRITPSIRIIDNEILEKQEFHRYLQQFISSHPEYNDFYRILYNHDEPLNLIKSLASKGIFPTRNGWFRNSEKYLDGDYDEFKRIFDRVNQPIPGSRGPKQSELRGRLNDYKYKCFPPDAPDADEIRIKDEPQVPEEFAETAFYENREELKNFIHDLYFEYIEYSLGRNYLNFSFMMMLAYSLLYENHKLREQLRFEYVMIDEFQDTNEIQFKLAMLLSKGNFCVVGDWKQSIFAFQYASVDNIIQFRERLGKYKEDLNQGYQRIDYPVDSIREIPLTENYRSTQNIIDFSEQALMLEATKNEVLDKEEIQSRIIHLNSVNNYGPTEISAYTGEDQKQVILRTITDIVDNSSYTFVENGHHRPIKYQDIAVLTRTRKFGLELHSMAQEYNIPVAYEGGIELFRTAPALMLIAWLRVLNFKDSKKGWSVILEGSGYTLDEVKHILHNKNYPQDMLDFLGELKEIDSIGAIARYIFNKYGIHGVFPDRIIEILQNSFDNTEMNTGELINFIEDNIWANTTYEVDGSQGDDAFKIQTIHSAKGLEYPVVILPDLGVNTGGYRGSIDYREPLGLRQNKLYHEDPFPYTYDNWKSFLVSRCLSGDYDEERRLLYVAMTRSENYLFLTADSDKYSEFFNNLDIDSETVDSVVKSVEPIQYEKNMLTVDAPANHGSVKLSSHSLFHEHSFDSGGSSAEYGLKVHQFAENYAKGLNVVPDDSDETNVKDFIDSLKGDLICEKECL
ncbi:MAG: UvrD-helicase domain-containing protein, partial [Methanohalobium sp.]|uniref:UvrD-helicase domain-containing protein n=1 Tax=Methanohalobium sp. TaxID=2837493 RepID=UPI00397B9278